MIRTTISKSGPFFTNDPAKTFRQNIRVMLEAVAREGQADVDVQIAPHSRTGRTEAGVVGRVHSVSGRPWALTAVISQSRVFPWHKHGKRGFTGRGEAEYRGGKLEAQVHMFRKTTSRLRASRAVNQAELTKGLE